MGKKCCRCKEVKLLDDFHRDKNRKDGRYPVCKVCQRIKQKDLAEYRRNYYLNYNKGLPAEQKRAVALIYQAIKKGRIKRGSCEICGKTKSVQGHHRDYSKPLEVNWLCISHHKRLHLIK